MKCNEKTVQIYVGSLDLCVYNNNNNNNLSKIPKY